MPAGAAALSAASGVYYLLACSRALNHPFAFHYQCVDEPPAAVAPSLRHQRSRDALFHEGEGAELRSQRAWALALWTGDQLLQSLVVAVDYR